MSNFITPNIKNSKLAFDPIELKNKIIERLNQSNVFTDQNYEGSNLAAINDIIGYVFGTLMYYLSKTTSESMFSESQIYENINRIVKLLDYNPVGRLTQNVQFSLNFSNNLPAGTYTLPRFSYVTLGQSVYTLTSELAFSYNTDNAAIPSSFQNYTLYQGSMEEYPLYTAMGINHEVIYLSLAKNVTIDHFNIFVYVKSKNSKWKEWNRVENTSFSGPNDNVFRVRFNANKRYEITFGDNINGASLKTDDEVVVYYLKVNPNALSIGAGTLDGYTFSLFRTPIFKTITDDLQTLVGAYVTTESARRIYLSNKYPSTDFIIEEDVESIRTNAPKIFRSQNRLITESDYTYFIKKEFSNIITDVKVVNNDQYLAGHMQYLYNIGLKNPQLDNLVLYNQVKFANSCNFNNIYIYGIPRNKSLYLSPGQKEYIINNLQNQKSITSQLVYMDPELMYFDFCVTNNSSSFNPSTNSSKIQIVKSSNNKRSDASIKFDVINTIENFFVSNQSSLGSSIDIPQLNSLLNSLDGVLRIQTFNSIENLTINELSFMVWNSRYQKNDSKLYSQTVALEYFQYPSLYNISSLSDRIEIINSTTSVKVSNF